MISNQICRHKGSKKLIEFTDKLKEPKPEEYAKLHDQYSVIGVSISDYSKGKGDKLVYTNFNLAPSEVKQIYRDLIKINDRIYHQMAFAQLYSLISTIVSGLDLFFRFFQNLYLLVNEIKIFLKKENGPELPERKLFASGLLERIKHNPFIGSEFNLYSAAKIYASQTDDKGYAPMFYITISYVPRDQSGNPMTAPWKIAIDNGVAKATKTATGGFCAEGGTYKSKTMAFVFLTEKEIEKLFRSTCDFINVFETTISFKAVRDGRKAWAEEQEKKKERRDEHADNSC